MKVRASQGAMGSRSTVWDGIGVVLAGLCLGSDAQHVGGEGIAVMKS